MKAYLEMFSNFLDFKGEISRGKFWQAVGINVVITFILWLINIFVGQGESKIGIIMNVYTLLVAIPMFAMMIRRLHNIGRSGWNLLWGLLPIVGEIILLVQFLKSSDSKNN